MPQNTDRDRNFDIGAIDLELVEKEDACILSRRFATILGRRSVFKLNRSTNPIRLRVSVFDYLKSSIYAAESTSRIIYHLKYIIAAAMHMYYVTQRKLDFRIAYCC